MSGKWEKLTEYLANNGSSEIILNDDQIQSIIGSSDKERPYRMDHPTHSIRNRANGAGYDVARNPRNKQIKIFSKRN
jgi:hypothetical protein